MSDNRIQAAGGLVVRRKKSGAVRVLVVHRPGYDDWSLPKGKADAGETPEETAIREVEEETGVSVRIVAPIGEVEYKVQSGRKKVVRYFAMRPISRKPFEPNSEVDEIRWLSPKKARALVSYERDRELLDADYESILSSGVIWLIRHAAAGDRHSWDGDDTVRPLTGKGERQAEALADVLASAGVDHVVSSPYVRCRETVEPLARATGRSVEESHHLAEGANGKHTLEWLLSFTGRTVAACSHGDVIPEILRALERNGVELRSDHGPADVKKGSTWTLRVEAGAVTSATYQPPPDV